MKNIRSRIPESTPRFISHSANYDAQSCTHAAAITRRPGLSSHCAPPLPVSNTPNTRACSNNFGMRARCCCAQLRISGRASLPQPPAPALARRELVRGCHRRKLLHIQTLRISFRAARPARIQQRQASQTDCAPPTNLGQGNHAQHPCAVAPASQISPNTITLVTSPKTHLAVDNLFHPHTN